MTLLRTNKLSRLVLANTVMVCLLFLGNVLSSHGLLHADHQDGHQSTKMHTDLLCAWLCAAGQVLQAADSSLFPPFLVFVATDCWGFPSTDLLLVQSSHSRDPPPYRIDFT